MSDEGVVPSTEERWRELHEKPLEELTDAEVTSKIRLSVRRRFDSPEWELAFEYGAPGADGSVADAIAVNTLPSRNYKVVAFEFKASRSDWLREKKDGQKADYFVRLADEFYLVAPKGVVEESELPEGWGYLELKPNSEQLYKERDSELTEHQQGEPPRRFWVKFVERGLGGESNFSKEDVREARSRGYEEALDEGVQDREIERNLDRLRRKADSWDELQDTELDFLPGYRFSEENARTLELAYRLIKKIRGERVHSVEGQVEFLQRRVEQTAEEVQEELDELAGGLDTLEERISRGEDPIAAVQAEDTTHE